MKYFYRFLYALLFLPLFLSAQDEIKDTLWLPSLLLESPSWADQGSPQVASTISSRDIRLNYNGAEPSFLLQRTPSLTLYSDAGSQFGYSYFRLRGIDQTRVNVSLDGVPLNEPEDQGIYFSNFDNFLQSVRSVQLQRGVGISTNGAAAYAGSLLFASPGMGGDRAWEVSAGYGSFASYRLSAMYQTGDVDDWHLYTSVSRTESEGFKDHSDHEGGSIFFQTGIKKQKHLWKLTGFMGRQRNQMAWLGVNETLLEENDRTNANAEQERDDFSQGLVKLQHVYIPNLAFSWSSSLYFGWVDGNYDFDLNNFLGFPSTEELYNYQFNSQHRGILSNIRYQKNDWLVQAGLHGQLYYRDHLGSERNLGQLYLNTGFKDELSAFLTLERTFGNWRLRAEQQYRATSFRYEGAVALEDLSWDFFNYKASLLRDISRYGTAYISFGQTQREPTRNDIFGGNDDLLANSLGQALTFVTQPEQVRDLEMGFRWNRGAWKLDVNAYYLRFQDEIVLNGQFGPNGLALRANVAKSFRSGLEMAAKYRITKNWELDHNTNISRNRIKEEDFEIEPILTPPLIINQGIGFYPKDWQLSLQFRYQSASYIDFANQFEIDGFTTLDARLGKDFGPFRLSLHVYNLTNSRYYGNGQLDINGQPAYHLMAPAHFFFNVQWRGR